MIANDWKIIYTKYEGVAKRAIQLLSKEAGALMIREPNVYRIQVLPCEKEGCAISKNAFFIGLYNDSATIRRYVSEDEVPKDGFLVKVIDNPEQISSCNIHIVTVLINRRRQVFRQRELT